MVNNETLAMVNLYIESELVSLKITVDPNLPF